MAEGDIHVYQVFKHQVLGGVFDLDTDTIKVSLVAAYTLDEDGDSVWTNVSTKEITDTSYAAQTLTGLTITASGTGSGTAVKGKWDAADVTWSSLTGTDPSHAIIWDDTPTAPADPLIAAVELTTATNGGNYTLSWNANGIIRIS
jgi:hypothetical protein